VWRWDNTDPFGANLPNENPSGLGNFEYNGGFPGQYRDKETGTFYNWHRTYRPDIGRYDQADPIGLAGGSNLYLYANANPLKFVDRNGLSPEDVKKIQQAIADCIEAMTKAGKRSSNGYINNYLPGTLDCGEQTESVIECLGKKNLKLDDNWQFYLRAGFGHAWGIGVSSNPGDAPLWFDPKWNNTSQGEPCKTCSGWGFGFLDKSLGAPEVPPRPQPPKPKK
jgi:RHS repeat-associated protein